ncbi:hypothetical protein Tco_1252355 [Tanacetum coccineum]
MGRTNVGRGGRSGRGGGRGLSDHKATRGVQKSIGTNTSGTRYKTNATVSFDTRVQKTIRTNTSGTRFEINTGVQKSIGTITSATHSETNATITSDTGVQKRVQKSIGTNTSSTRSEKNATISSDTRAQELVGDDEPNTNVSQHRRGSNIIEQVPQDPSKRTMISLDGGEYTNPKVVRADIAKITRKRLKSGKHEHGNERARKKPGESYQGQKSNP